MAPTTRHLALLLAAGAPTSVSAASVTPIAKVLSMMEDLLAKGKAEKEDEAVKYSAFEQWCGGQSRVKKNEIDQGATRIEELSASIEKSDVQARELSSRISELEEDIGRWAKDRKAAAAVREKETTDYRATVLDYTESIDALRGAIGVLKRQAYSREQAEGAFAQVSSRALVPSNVKSALTALLQHRASPDERLFRDAPEAYGYEFQSGGVIEMLQKLEDEFNTKKAELMAEEQKAQHGFERIAQQLTDSSENAEHEAAQKRNSRGAVLKAKAEAEGDLAQTEKDKKEDEEYLASMQALCERKAADFESRQKLRAQELEAIAKAVEIIGSHTVAGAGEEHLPAAALLATARRATALSQVQLRGGRGGDPWQQRLASFLESRARRSGSEVLSRAALQVAKGGPFDKVKKLIKDLISQLMEEATRETEHKGWCDTELANNKLTREARTEDVDSLSADVEGLTAEIAQLSQDTEELTSAVQELDAAMAKQNEERSTTKAANAQTVKEAKDAQVAVQEAIAVLREFYAQSAQATSLAQTATGARARQEPADDAPETFDKPYQGMMPEGGNVVDFLEVVLSDFARLEAETASSEASAVQDHDTFMAESEKDKALKQAEIEHKSETRVRKESELHSAKAELKRAQEQIDKAQAYYEKLRPTCVDAGVTYEERVKRREEEIESLKEALKILQGQDLPTLE
eukprot:TRINITY_DN1150_c1_g1_i1.p1 TRINITY_DN1150_c1_g1~~TRINITY_DN1150_c1_g1_i1.p1  ORF type:complete len:693 (-),score=240.38 TRINITY_DN1150_c1_g1_i1:73-2151(-)